MEITILGIAGSPRKGGNTEKLVQLALNEASKLSGVRVDFISLAGMELKPCAADYLCFKAAKKGKLTPDRTCLTYPNDGANEIYQKMIKADAFIVGTPVYWGGPTAQLKALMDRSMGCEALGFAFRNKVGGVIAVATDKNGGQESTILDVQRWMLTHDMFVVGVGPDRPEKTSIGSYYGGITMQGFPYPVSSMTKESKGAALKDEIGIESVKGVGKRVAEATKIVKAGLTSVGAEGLVW